MYSAFDGCFRFAVDVHPSEYRHWLSETEWHKLHEGRRVRHFDTTSAINVDLLLD